MSIFAAPGLEPWLRDCQTTGRAPVLWHELGGEKERTDIGPRELLEQTRARLEGIGGLVRWGAGAKVQTPEEAALFATAGYTWFTFDLARVVNGRAAEISLDALDAALVELEDTGVFAPGWHDAYLDREFSVAPGLTISLPDEALARTAVKFAPLLAHAEEMDRVLRTCWVGRGELPEIEISLAPGPVATAPEEMLFLSMELRRRLSSFTAIAPAFGREFEPGADVPEDFGGLSALLAALSAAAAPVALSVPSALSALAPAGQVPHLDVTAAGRLAQLAIAARKSPEFFREWLEAARLAFPLSRTGWPISLTEEEARFLPQVEDADLEATFLGLTAGRQLLLSTWEDVSGSELGVRLRGI